jgi:aryl-alcohol dehydrogenase-like predicted oxidoreductase
MNYTVLGKENIKISQICIGTWAWGSKLVWGYGKGGYSDEDLNEAFKTSVSLGVNFFDTAEVYGWGRSEVLLGSFIRDSNANVVVSTKFAPYPYRFTRNDLLKALKNSLKRLGLKKVSLYQIHFPYTLVPIDEWLNALADAYKEGLTEAVGVSNFSLAQTKYAVSVLSKRGVQLTSNQVKFNLLAMNTELSALFEYCKKNGITVLAHSTIAQGVLTGKYSVNNPLKGTRRFMYSRAKLKQYEPLINTLTEIASKYSGTPSQAAINWVIEKGAVPLVGVKNARQAEENIKATEWSLDKEDVALLDKIAGIVLKTN